MIVSNKQTREALAESALKDVEKSLRKATGMLGFRPLTDDEASDPFIPDMVFYGPHPDSLDRAFYQIACAIASLGYPGHSDAWESNFVDALDALDTAVTDWLVSLSAYGRCENRTSKSRGLPNYVVAFRTRVYYLRLLSDLWEDLVRYREYAFGTRHEFDFLNPAHIRTTEWEV